MFGVSWIVVVAAAWHKITKDSCGCRFDILFDYFESIVIDMSEYLYYNTKLFPLIILCYGQFQWMHTAMFIPSRHTVECPKIGRYNALCSVIDLQIFTE